jgi:hypothetical protein
MFHLTRVLAIFSTLLLVSCASGPSGKSFDSALGEWKAKIQIMSNQSRSARMTIIDETKASYAFNGGRIFFYAVDDQGKWEGYWVENDAPDMSCTEQKDGSNVWGVVVFQFNDTYSSFTGDSDACGKGTKYPWNGYR